MKYQPVIGFEIHTELLTKTKMFCGCKVEFGAEPNTNVCPVCLGMPGSLPVPNKKAIEFTIRTALALNCKINKYTVFDRKNYYYPDLPKNYQISQNYNILGVNGYIDFELKNGTKKRVRINNVHIEEDAGKLIHPEDAYSDYSLVDLNRAGTPLIEIVTEPDMRSVEEAEAFMQAMRNLLEYIEVSDCKMQEGSLRFEVNISLMKKNSDKLGTKVEIKNLNSIKVALKVIEYEIKRQSKLLDRGEKVVQETRLWDEEAGKTISMRTKEEAKDYRYFPEPDLVPMEISDEWIDKVRRELPELRWEKKERFIKEYNLPDYDAEVLTANKRVADYFEEAVKVCGKPKAVSNWIMTEVLRELKKEEDSDIRNFPITAQYLGTLIKLIEKGTISGKIGKIVFEEMLTTGKDPQTIIKEKGLVQITDENAIREVVLEVLKNNPSVVENYKNGKTKVIGFLVGQVMKKTRGKANPQIVNKLLIEELNK